MMFLEMSRDETHGGGTWAFLNCVFAPTEKNQGAGRWPFWSNILKIRSGDVVLHLRGIPPHAFFVGYSEASSDGFDTSQRPPDPKAWSYSSRFYRADLGGYVSFHTPINLRLMTALSRFYAQQLEERRKRYGVATVTGHTIAEAGTPNEQINFP